MKWIRIASTEPISVSSFLWSLTNKSQSADTVYFFYNLSPSDWSVFFCRLPPPTLSCIRASIFVVSLNERTNYRTTKQKTNKQLPFFIRWLIHSLALLIILNWLSMKFVSVYSYLLIKLANRYISIIRKRFEQFVKSTTGNVATYLLSYLPVLHELFE